MGINIAIKVTDAYCNTKDKNNVFSYLVISSEDRTKHIYWGLHFVLPDSDYTT